MNYFKTYILILNLTISVIALYSLVELTHIITFYIMLLSILVFTLKTQNYGVYLWLIIIIFWWGAPLLLIVNSKSLQLFVFIFIV